MTRIDGGGSSGFSPERFRTVTDQIEELLADLMGIEAAAQFIRDFNVRTASGDAENVAPTVRPLTIPAKTAFTVYPTLPMIVDGDWQSLVSQAFEAGKGGAAAVGPWLRSLVSRFNDVDATGLVNSAVAQGAALETIRHSHVEHWANVTVLVDNNWEGGARDEFEIWAEQVTPVEDVLLTAAGLAHAAAAACGNVIGRSQSAMMAQAEDAKEALEDTLEQWRSAGDDFPYPPGVSIPLSQVMSDVEGKVNEVIGSIPLVGDFLRDKATGKAGKALKYWDVAKTAVEFGDSRNKTETPQPTAEEYLDALEKHFRRIDEDAEKEFSAAQESVATVADEVDRYFGYLRLERLPDPKNPGGEFQL
ncbi:hypothetical protein WBG06_04605 [Nocardioides sp. CCNWLW239]|uniref:hypothetical protein n=1 Tax=Nocardioides sp. CCNWLW239 TaxID=3128902 RepID=UPI0030195158